MRMQAPQSDAITSADIKNGHCGILVCQNEAKNIPRPDFMVMNISCKFEKGSYNICFVRAVIVYTLRQCNKAKSIVLTRCYPVDTIKEVDGLTVLYRHIYAVKGTILSHFSRPKVTLKARAKVNKMVLHHVLNLQSHFQ